MKNSTIFQVTREKHLDHMVRVVPFIVFCYAVQCYVIVQMAPTNFSSFGLTILGGMIALMVTGFITYDLKHQIVFYENELKVSFFSKVKTIRYEDIWVIEVTDPSENFSTLTLRGENKKDTFYFVDDAEKIKKWIEEKKQAQLNLAA
jgi:hypothetical protein